SLAPDRARVRLPPGQERPQPLAGGRRLAGLPGAPFAAAVLRALRGALVAAQPGGPPGPGTPVPGPGPDGDRRARRVCRGRPVREPGPPRTALLHRPARRGLTQAGLDPGRRAPPARRLRPARGLGRVPPAGPAFPGPPRRPRRPPRALAVG